MTNQTKFLPIDEAADQLKVSVNTLLTQATEGFQQLYWLLNKTLKSDKWEWQPTGVFPAYPGQDIEEWSANIEKVSATKYFTFIPLAREKAGELLTKNTTKCYVDEIRTPEETFSLDEPELFTITRQHLAFVFDAIESQCNLSLDQEWVSEQLRIVNQASKEFWSTADRDDRSTHPKNEDVKAWLIDKGFSATLADKSATIIRPDWVTNGRRPKK